MGPESYLCYFFWNLVHNGDSIRKLVYQYRMGYFVKECWKYQSIDDDDDDDDIINNSTYVVSKTCQAMI